MDKTEKNMNSVMVKRYVVINLRFTAIHRWPDCDIEEVAYLKHPHRHEFHVCMRWPVFHNDRDIEFIRMKNEVQKFVALAWEGQNLGAESCEGMAEHLMHKYKACYVSVFEDGENGAEIISEGY